MLLIKLAPNKPVFISPMTFRAVKNKILIYEIRVGPWSNIKFSASKIMRVKTATKLYFILTFTPFHSFYSCAIKFCLRKRVKIRNTFLQS